MVHAKLLKRTAWVAALSAVAVAGVSCTRQAPTSTDALSSDLEAFSNRGEKGDAIILIKFREAALMTGVDGTVGNNTIDPERLKKVEDNHKVFDKFIEDLRAKTGFDSSQLYVVYRYKNIVNGVALVTPAKLRPIFEKFAGATFIEESSLISRPESQLEGTFIHVATDGPGSLFKNNTVKFLGADKVRAELKDAYGNPLDGTGMRVGIIDTGVDYTHAMFGGAGTPEAYEAVNPNTKAGSGFPNAHVTGGYDFVGTEYDGGAFTMEYKTPRPDDNPIDEAEHGTHVAGTVGGVGDGTNTFDGAAPKADLYALKVFGKEGSTNDSAIIAALDYAAAPNGDAKKQLHVVNLSLGSGYGTSKRMYTEAIGNLAKAGTMAVISAGNSGPVQFIVGSPGTTSEALSVAASTDNMDYNWRFGASRIGLPGGDTFVESIDSAFGVPAQSSDVEGSFSAPVGNLSGPVSDAAKAAMNGKIALIDRGAVTFFEKAQKAVAAGAIGIVVVNNNPGEPIAMGGGAPGSIPVPAIMISQAMGNQVKAALKAGQNVGFKFKTDKTIDKPWLVDSITSFSSRGPRSLDGQIKPEISSPGNQIISAATGTGFKGQKMSGTSMAAPNMTGIATLVRQAWPKADVDTVKSMVMGTSLPISGAFALPGLDDTPVNQTGVYPVSIMGAGRVQAWDAVTTGIASYPHSISLGIQSVSEKTTLTRSVRLANHSSNARTFELEYVGRRGLGISGPSKITLAGNAATQLDLSFQISAPEQVSGADEMDGFVNLKANGKVVYHIPVLALVKRDSQIYLKNASTTDRGLKLDFGNFNNAKGDAQVFQFLGERAFDKAIWTQPALDTDCDLESAGWRIVTGDNGARILQFGYKLRNPQTSWNLCEYNALIDTNNDGVAELESIGALANAYSSRLPGQLFTILADAGALQKIRQDAVAAFDPTKGKKLGDIDYLNGLVDLQPLNVYTLSTLVISSIDLSNIVPDANGHIRVKLAVTNSDTTNFAADQFLSDGWLDLDLSNPGLSGAGLATTVAGKSTAAPSVVLNTQGKGQAVVYFPNNYVTTKRFARDLQTKVVPFGK